MANSLRSKLSKLRHDRHITEEEYQAFVKKLDGHDKQIRVEERKSVIEEFRNYLKTVTPCEMPQEYWDMGVDNTCDRMLKENK